MDRTETIDIAEIENAPQPSRFKRLIRIIGWVSFAFVCLTIFTLIKLPSDKVKNYVEGNISSALAREGIVFSSKKASLSLGLGLIYEMSDVTLTFPQDRGGAIVEIDNLQISPSLLSFLLGKYAGKFWIDIAAGKGKGSFSVKQNDVDIEIKLKNLDLGRLELLKIAVNAQASALASGSIIINGKIDAPNTLDGDIRLKLEKIKAPEQQVMGFTVPPLSISEGTIDLDVDNGKATIETMTLGKAGSDDSLVATLNGDVALGKQWASTVMNLKTNFSLSPSIKKSFVFVDALLAAGKQTDGSYTYNVSGAVFSPKATPQKAQ